MSNGIQEGEVIVFDMYYSGLMAMNLHPGTTRDPPSRKNVHEVAEIALMMLEVRRSLLPADSYEGHCL